MSKGVNAKGIECQMIREGDNLEEIVVNAILNETIAKVHNSGSENPIYYNIKDNDIIGITESVVARADGNYVTVDEIAEETTRLYGQNPEILLIKPIYSRNRFSMILKGIARAASKLYIQMPNFDEVGNPRGVNKFTGVNIEEYYKNICASENCEVEIIDGYFWDKIVYNQLYCGLHDYENYLVKCRELGDMIEKKAIEGGYSDTISSKYNIHTLADICSEKCQYGVLGSNKANEERLKLFPEKTSAEKMCMRIKESIYQATGKSVIVCVYGDGCFKDPVGGIWEFADPVTMPAYTDKELLESTPNEIKVKAFADDKYKNLSGEELTNAIKKEMENKTGNSTDNQMSSQGTTPRLYRDLIASLMDLISGSGDRCTPIVYITNYFRG